MKESIVRRYLSTEATYQELASETGADPSSVRYWVRKFREQGKVGRKRKKKLATVDDRSPAEKLQLLLEAKTLDEEALGEFLRREGLREGDLERWEREALNGLAGRAEDPSKDRRIEELERDGQRQAKRLKEARALLDLQKKVQELWADEDDDTTRS